MKKNSFCRHGCFHIERTNMWGNYNLTTGEYYLANYNGVTFATRWYDRDGYCHVYSARGYSYQAIRELLQLGHLTSKTLEQFQQAGGKVWWEQQK